MTTATNHKKSTLKRAALRSYYLHLAQDGGAAAVAVYTAAYLAGSTLQNPWLWLGFIALAKLLILKRVGYYKQVPFGTNPYKHALVSPNIVPAAKAALWGGFIVAAISYFAGLPARAIPIEFLLFTAYLYATDTYRMRQAQSAVQSRLSGKPILLYGAGVAGKMILNEIMTHPELRYMPVGFIDDDPQKIGTTCYGSRVWGDLSEVPQLVKRFEVCEIMLTMPSCSGDRVRKIYEELSGLPVKVRTIPKLCDLIDDKVHMSLATEINIEHLLHRPKVTADLDIIATTILNRCVLVTGAAGSIGSELCRQIANFAPRTLILFDHEETNSFHITNELKAIAPQLDIITVLGDVRDRNKVFNTFKQYRPNHIFHAAAYKHVSLVEDNADEAVKTNVFGTLNVIDAAIEYAAERFVMISTDKAVNPTNVMGATKRLAELLVLTAPQRKTELVTVRFGNVLGSRGSVVPIFLDQIKKGGPITITHPDMVRYFMTIPEAVLLVLQAGSMATGRQTYILDMGKPIKIRELAEDLIRLSGATPYRDIDIIYTGLRPGEKLYEELLIQGENLHPTISPQISAVSPTHPHQSSLQEDLNLLNIATLAGDQQRICTLLRHFVPSYSSSRHKS